LRPRINDICDELIAGFRCRGRADLIRDFAAILPLTIISEMFGLPPADRPMFRQWTLTIGGVDEKTVERQPQAYAELSAYLNELIERKSRQRDFARTDLLGALIALRDEGDGDRLTHEELFGTASVLLLAGHGTTVNLIGNGMLMLLRHPDQLAALRADASLVDRAVEEFLRYEGPLANPALRYTRDALLIGGTSIPANEVLLLSLPSANRDPRQFAAPDVFDVHRTDHQAHLAFGHGIHYCIGAPPARLEARIAHAAHARHIRRLRDLRRHDPDPHCFASPGADLDAPGLRRRVRRAGRQARPRRPLTTPKPAAPAASPASYAMLHSALTAP
jgi:cytochrome P450